MTPRLLTVGHGTLDTDELLGLLRDAGVQQVVDVRRFPGSRRHPQVRREALAEWLPRAGIGYRWEQGLGGRRRESGDSPDVWWRVAAFRGYAAHMRSEEFAAGMERLAEDVAAATSAVMCSESLWWRCHRRIVSDVAVLLHEIPVRHLGHDGRTTAHQPSAGARVTPEGLVYDLDG